MVDRRAGAVRADPGACACAAPERALDPGDGREGGRRDVAGLAIRARRGARGGIQPASSIGTGLAVCAVGERRCDRTYRPRVSGQRSGDLAILVAISPRPLRRTGGCAAPGDLTDARLQCALCRWRGGADCLYAGYGRAVACVSARSPAELFVCNRRPDRAGRHLGSPRDRRHAGPGCSMGHRAPGVGAEPAERRWPACREL